MATQRLRHEDCYRVSERALMHSLRTRRRGQLRLLNDADGLTV